MVGSAQFGGRSAPGKLVTLQRQAEAGAATVPGQNGQPREALTDSSGIYGFTGLPPGDYRVVYVSRAAPDGMGAPLVRGEVGTWTSRWQAVAASGGARVPPFDVQYNGPIFPAVVGSTYYVSQNLVLPFHWSTHRLGQRYRLKVFNQPSGLGGELLASDWSRDPAALVRRDVLPGRYSWSVMIDAGEAGEGTSEPRALYLSSP